MLRYKKKIADTEIEREFEKISLKIHEIKLPQGFLDFVMYVISELLTNVQEHAKAKDIFLEIKLDKGKFNLSVADNGIGLRKSYLLKEICPKDDLAAIEFALSGLSTKDPRERGFGLYSIRNLVKALKGEMLVSTGKARVQFRQDTITLKGILYDAVEHYKKVSKSIKGVKIELETKLQAINIYKFL